MRIHTDKLSIEDIEEFQPPRSEMILTTHGSRKRDHAFEVKLVGEPGKDRHGITRRFSTGGAYGSTDGRMRALTWVEWGDFICELLKIDPDAIVGVYEGEHDFIEATQSACVWRPQREGAPEHADRWASNLYWARDKRISEASRPFAEVSA